jgi:hypothetical protein
MQQILWERGLWVDGMKCQQSKKEIKELEAKSKPILDDHLNMHKVLGNCGMPVYLFVYNVNIYV